MPVCLFVCLFIDHWKFGLLLSFCLVIETEDVLFACMPSRLFFNTESAQASGHVLILGTQQLVVRCAGDSSLKTVQASAFECCHSLLCVPLSSLLSQCIYMPSNAWNLVIVIISGVEFFLSVLLRFLVCVLVKKSKSS